MSRVATSASCGDVLPAPPVPKKIPTTVTFGVKAGEDRGEEAMDPPLKYIDDLFWLRDDERKDEEVLAHLNAENAYTEAATAHLAAARESLYAEFKSHLKETDEVLAYPWGDLFDYYTRTVEGSAYKIHCRRARAGGAEQVFLDENIFAKPHKFFSLGAVQPSPSHGLLAYSADTSGSETYEVRVVDLATGERLPDVVPEAASTVQWGADDAELYYLKMDAAHRPYQLWRHRLGKPNESDELLFTEDDDKFCLGIQKTSDGEFLLARSASKETSEIHAKRLADDAATPLVCLAPRRFGVLYEADHRADRFLILTNDNGRRNFDLMQAPDTANDPSAWTALPHFAYDPSRYLKAVRCFKDFVVAFGRCDGLTSVWVLPMEGAVPVASHRLEMPEAAYWVAYSSTNKQFDTPTLRLDYSSMTTPQSTLACDMSTRQISFLKEREVPNYDRSLYTTLRTSATARDGTQVPISVVYRTDRWRTDGTEAPGAMLLYGYGSYGVSMEPTFSSARLVLLDRGVAFAIAHVRGGAEMGRAWYEEQGKYLNKRNTFTDFIDCAKELQTRGLTSPRLCAIEGRSAGGMLIGGVLNEAPELFAAAVAGVPCVDLMVTMCDPSIPLVCGEWEEWGNPNNAKYHEYMRSYSPMENVRPQDYPSILALGGLHDPRVQYWEPAKWVARLREACTDNSKPVLLKMDMESGHFSASDRYKYLEQLAFDYAFVLDRLGRLEAL